MNVKKILQLSFFVLIIAMLSCKKTSVVIPDVSVSPVPSTPEEMAEALGITLPEYSVICDSIQVENGVQCHTILLVFEKPINGWVDSSVKNDTTWVDNANGDGYIKDVRTQGVVSVEKTMISSGLNVCYDIVVHGYISPEHNGIKLCTLDNSENVKSDMPFQPQNR